LSNITDALGRRLNRKINVILEQRDGMQSHMPQVTEPFYDPKWNDKELKPIVVKVFTMCNMPLKVLIRHKNKTASYFTVAGYKEDESEESEAQRQFAASFILLLRGIAKTQGHELMHDPSLGEQA
jgi:hypothetical protein